MLLVPHDVHFPKLGQSFSFEYPSPEFLLAVDVDVDIVVEVSEDACVDDGGDE